VFDHHLTKDIEKDGNCIYCSEKLDSTKWTSKFSSRNHYKCVICKCGKQNCVEVGFIGTGHDGWSDLEKKVEKSSNVKIVNEDVRIL